jgi:hypothetical protein
MNTQDLAKAVVYWLEYERLCGREKLLSEASLKQPIGEFLLSTQDHQLEAETPYPDEMQPGRGRRRSADFCLKRMGGAQAWTDLLEAKWVNGKRDLAQEIFDDLLRLEIVRRPEQFRRCFLLAGATALVTGAAAFQRQANDAVGGLRFTLFESVLPTALGASLNVDVARARREVAEFWIEAARAINEDTLPLSISVTLEAVASNDFIEFGCWVWRVNSVNNRSTRTLAEVHAQ